jgi:hypothetical protein
VDDLTRNQEDSARPRGQIGDLASHNRSDAAVGYRLSPTGKAGRVAKSLSLHLRALVSPAYALVRAPGWPDAKEMASRER